MAPCTPLVSRALLPAPYITESPYTRKRRANILGHGRFTTSHDPVLSAPPVCKFEPEIEGVSDSGVDAMIQRSYAIKQAFYETRRAEGDENPKMEQARQEEEKEVKLEVLLHEVSAPDAGGDPDSEPIDQLGAVDCACLPLKFSLYGLCEHRQRFGLIHAEGEDNAIDDLATNGIYTACLEDTNPTKPRPESGELTTTTFEDCLTGNGPASLLDLSSSTVGAEKVGYASYSALRPLPTKPILGFVLQTVGPGDSNICCKGPRYSTLSENGQLAPYLERRDGALQLISHTASPIFGRGALRPLVSIPQSPYRHTLLARPIHFKIADLLNELGDHPQAAVFSPLLALQRRSHPYQCHRSMKAPNAFLLRTAHLGRDWSYGYRGHASSSHESGSSSGLGGFNPSNNGYSGNGSTHNSREQLDEPQQEFILDGEILFGDPFRRLFMEADSMGFYLALHPKRLEPSTALLFDQHNLPSPSDIPLPPPLQYSLPTTTFSPSYSGVPRYPDALPANQFSQPNFGRSEVPFNAPLNELPDRYAGLSGWAASPMAHFPSHAQFITAPPSALNIPQPPPTAAYTSSHHDNFILVGPTAEPVANESAGATAPASRLTGPDRFNPACRSAKQPRKISIRKGLNKTCLECDRTFSRPQELADHMSTHTKVKAYICSNCNKALSTRSNLKRHCKQRVCMR